MDTSNTLQLVADFAGTLCNVAICFIFMTTMFQLTNSIKMIGNELDVHTASRRNTIFTVVSIFIYAIFAVLIIGSLI